MIQLPLAAAGPAKIGLKTARAPRSRLGDILLTFDTEFSLGYRRGSGLAEPVTDRAVFCRDSGRSHGLGFVLQTLAANRLTATFFVEAAHTAVLGPEPMRPAIEAIVAAGHDIQLHLHPLWLAVENGRVRQPVNDSMAALDASAASRLVAIGLEAFGTWKLPPPIAFRAGNLQIGRAIYSVLKAHGIAISSSVGLAVSPPADPLLRMAAGRKLIDGVVEVPVLTYADMAFGPRLHLKNLTVTGCGTAEAKSVLRQAVAAGCEEIVLLSHPFEFIKRSDQLYSRIVRNRVNQNRLKALCHWITTPASGLRAVTFRDKATEWLAEPNADAPRLIASPEAVFRRLVQNRLNDLIWRY